MVQNHTDDESELKKDLSARLDVIGGEQQERLARHRADMLHLPYISLVIFPIDPDVIEVIPKREAEAAAAVLFYKQGRDIRVGAVNPHAPESQQLVEQLTARYGTQVQVHVISPRSLAVALKKYRREKALESQPRDEVRVGTEQAALALETVRNLEELGKRIISLPPSQVLNAIVAGGVKMGASDIHIEPREKEARLRYRIDGVLQDITTFDRQGWALMLSRIKVLSKLKLNIHATPQDGSFVLQVGKEIYDMRVSVLPGEAGESIVIRLLSRASELLKVTDLGMKQRDYAVVQRELKKANGMILVTGPTGSGKTTTLASFVNEVNTPGIKIITLEDPVEYRIPGVEQTEVDAEAGYTFAAGLRSILRQDPDMIMVGEMRDVETAEVAVHASLTGHLVFTTLHTNDAPGAVPRLVAMGVKPFVLAPALNVVIAQRLVRVVCKDCAEAYRPDAKELDTIREALEGVIRAIFDPASLADKNLKLYRSHGCSACNETGYQGRIGVFEIFSVTDTMEDLVLKGADSLSIRQEALKQGMTTIAQDAYLKAIEGVTTIEEVERISEE